MARPLHSPLDVMARAQATQAAQPHDHQAMAVLTAQVAQLTEALTSLRKQSAKQAVQLSDAMIEIATLQDAAQADALSLS
jgi:hypothetical protein